MSPEPTEVRSYTAESPAASPWRMLHEMFADLLDSRELARQLARRDIVAQYRESMLGIVWAFVPPLLSGLVFILLRESEIVNIPDPGPPYAVYVLVGTSLWQVFTEAVGAPLKVVRGAQAILAKVRFPREALILSAGYQVLFGLFTRAVLIALVLLYFGIPIHIVSMAAILPVLMMIWLGMVIGLLLTPIGMLLADVSSMITIGLQMAFFLTPVVYPPPEQGVFALVVQWNPVSPFLMAGRDLLLSGSIDSWGRLLLSMPILVAASLLAWIAYRMSMPIVIERISA